MNFRTGFLDSKTDELILDSRKIAINYLKGRFWVDVLATLPLEYIGAVILEGDTNSQ